MVDRSNINTPEEKKVFSTDLNLENINVLGNSLDYQTLKRTYFSLGLRKKFGTKAVIRKKEVIADQIIDQLSSQDSSKEKGVQMVKKGYIFTVPLI